MFEYFELLAVLLLGVAPNILFFFMPKQLRKGRRMSIVSLLGSILHSIGTVFLILCIALREETSLLSIGIDTTRFDLLWAGVVLVSFFILIYAFIVKTLFKGKEDTYQKDFRKEILEHKSFREKLLLLSFVSLTAVSEELVFRGYFILIWGQRTGYPVICAVISSIIFIALHLHRGRKAIPYYTALTILLAIPAVYANTILVSIGMHLYLNIAVTLGIWIRARKKVNKQQTDNTQPLPQPALPPQKNIPNSKTAIILFICSWIAIPFSLFLFAIPSAIIIPLAIFDMIRIRRKKGEMVGRGFCVASIFVSMLPILAIATFFALPYIFDFIFYCLERV